MTLNDIKTQIDNFVESNKKYFEHFDFIVGVSRGGLIPAALIATKLNKPLVTAYIDPNDNIYFDRANWIENKKVLVVDDIIRSGRTLTLLSDYLKRNTNPTSISYYTIYSVRKLRSLNYSIVVTSKEVEEDVIFPWDYENIN